MFKNRLQKFLSRMIKYSSPEKIFALAETDVEFAKFAFSHSEVLSSLTYEQQQRIIQTYQHDQSFLSTLPSLLSQAGMSLADIIKPHNDTNNLLSKASTNYWTLHNVTNHRQFASCDESLNYLEWRNAQYYNYATLMPVSGLNDKVILDYGCGPGHDLVGFGHYSKPHKLIGMDLSPTSLNQAKERLALHNITAELIRLSETDTALPLEDASIDYIHSSGVLHHVSNIDFVLQEFKRVLKPNGKLRIMVYNYQSIWLHLYVAYLTQTVEKKYTDLDVRSAFSRTTDGIHCPISNVYTPNEFKQLGEKNGFKVDYSGAAVSVFEMSQLHKRFDAIMNPELPREHREFLATLTFDDKNLPMYKGHYAGIDACYLFSL